MVTDWRELQLQALGLYILNPLHCFLKKRIKHLLVAFAGVGKSEYISQRQRVHRFFIKKIFPEYLHLRPKQISTATRAAPDQLVFLIQGFNMFKFPLLTIIELK